MWPENARRRGRGHRFRPRRRIGCGIGGRFSRSDLLGTGDVLPGVAAVKGARVGDSEARDGDWLLAAVRAGGEVPAHLVRHHDSLVHVSRATPIDRCSRRKRFEALAPWTPARLRAVLAQSDPMMEPSSRQGCLRRRPVMVRPGRPWVRCSVNPFMGWVLSCGAREVQILSWDSWARPLDRYTTLRYYCYTTLC